MPPPWNTAVGPGPVTTSPVWNRRNRLFSLRSSFPSSPSPPRPVDNGGCAVACPLTITGSRSDETKHPTGGALLGDPGGRGRGRAGALPVRTGRPTMPRRSEYDAYKVRAVANEIDGYDHSEDASGGCSRQL